MENNENKVFNSLCSLNSQAKLINQITNLFTQNLSLVKPDTPEWSNEVIYDLITNAEALHDLVLSIKVDLDRLNKMVNTEVHND